MSRVGKDPIIPQYGVEVLLDNGNVVIKGPLGTVSRDCNLLVNIAKKDNGALIFFPKKESVEANAMTGTMRALVANMIVGVTKGFEKKLILVGVGYRLQIQGKKLILSLGFSHTVDHLLPDGIEAEATTQTEVTIKGIDKQLVGQQAAKIRGYRSPEPYKGKGIRYAEEIVILKESKKR